MINLAYHEKVAILVMFCLLISHLEGDTSHSILYVTLEFERWERMEYSR